MGFLLKLLFGGGGSVVSAIGSVIDKFHADSVTGEAVKASLAAKADEVEAEFHKAEVNSRNWFVADALPFAQWTVGIALAIYLLPHHFIIAFYWSYGVIATGVISEYPASKELLHLVVMVLGLGGIRALKAWVGK